MDDVVLIKTRVQVFTFHITCTTQTCCISPVLSSGQGRKERRKGERKESRREGERKVGRREGGRWKEKRKGQRKE